MISKSEFDSLKAGDKVQIVSNWSSDSNQNSDGLMDHWLGQIMTIKCVMPSRMFEPRVHMEEDQHERGGG